MSRGPLAWSRAQLGVRIACVGAFAAVTAGAGSCAASTSSSVTTTGKTLTIYLSAPPGNADLLDAERLAFSQKHGEVASFRVRMAVLQGKPSDNARVAIQDDTTIAYIGEATPGASADSMGITNAQDVLQVSPTDTAIELTEGTAAVPGAPDEYYEALKTYGRTFARVVPNADQEAKALLARMAASGFKRLYVTDDGSAYGDAVAYAIRQGAGGQGIAVTSNPAGADAAFDGASSPGAAVRRFEALQQSSPTIHLFGPSALLGASFPPTLKHVYISTPGFLDKDLPPAGRKFVSDFEATYGHAPAVQAIFGYEAVAAVLDDLRGLGAKANDRGKVVSSFFHISGRSSVLGTYSINSNGDTSIAPFVLSQLAGNKLVPLRAGP